MTYQVTYTETTNPAKPPITVADQTINQETSLAFVGKNYAGYAPVIAENFLHLLENFACPDSGSNTPTSALLNSPRQGQLWYNTTKSVLNVYDGTTWNAAGAVKKSTSTPISGVAGDLWVDTDNQQLYLYSGSTWLLVGPQYSAGTQTGPAVESITDTNDTDHNVLTFYANNNKIAIVSKESFAPKQTIPGFTTIGQGINLTSVDASSSSAPTKFWGTASRSDALNVNGSPIGASNFLRSDVTSTTNFSFNVRNNNGLTIGGDLSFNLSTDSSATVMYNKTSGASIDFRLNNNGTVNTVLHVDARNRIGIGASNTNPSATLDVAGDVLASGTLAVTDTTESTAVGIGSISTSGGLSVDKSINVGKDVNVYGNIYVNNLDTNGNPVGDSVILPGTDSANNLYDIGSSTRKFRNVYAQTFQGNFNGAFTGALSGNITGSASKLASATDFKLSGDVTSNTISFDGQTQNGTATFVTTVSQDFISGKLEATDSLNSDELLIYRSGTGLRRTSKQTFISNIATVPVGSIMPFAGANPPAGYLFCDGSEVPIGTYSALFQIIKYTYKPAVLLLGKNTFAIPDLRGRFPLGRDNMDNGLTVQDKNSTDLQPLYIDAGGGSANRVTDVTADTIGSGSGSDNRSLDIKNIPEHRHTLSSGQADYFAIGRPGLTTDTNGVSPPGPQSTSSGLAVPNTGGVLTSQTGLPVDIMNPYQTINYIIFTGVLL